MRTWFTIGVIFIVTALYALVVMVHMFLWRNPDVFFLYARSWAKLLLRISRVHVTLSGTEHLDATKRYIFCSNHASLFDIPVIVANVPDNIRIMYKRELERIPIFGWCLRLSPLIAIDRQRSREASDTLNTVISSLATGPSVLVFPEGTRSSDGSVGEFRRGAFSIAVRSGRQIIPLALVGTSSILAKGARNLRGGVVELKIMPAIAAPVNPTRDVELDLMNGVRQIITEAVDLKQ